MSRRNDGVVQGESSANISHTGINFITYRIPPDPVEIDLSIEAALANSLYGKRLGTRKRQHMDASTLENPPQFQAGAKTGKKGQKKDGKKADPQSLLGMMNESTGAYNKLVSIRQMLKQNKVDISWMKWFAWSPDACKEILQLCTRVAKKNLKPSHLGKINLLCSILQSNYNRKNKLYRQCFQRFGLYYLSFSLCFSLLVHFCNSRNKSSHICQQFNNNLHSIMHH